MQIIKEYALKGILPVKDLLLSINCIPVDCKDLDRCCSSNLQNQPVAHFEVPQILMDYGNDSIAYIGSTDRQNPFRYSTSSVNWSIYNKYRKMYYN